MRANSLPLLSTSCLLVSVLLSGGAVALEVNSSVALKVKIAEGITSKNSGNKKFEFSAKPEINLNFGNGIKFTTIVKITNETNQQISHKNVSRDGYVSINKPVLVGDNSSIELRELYIEKSIGDHYLKLGKQQVVWGKADGLKILDIVNPQSFKEFILEPFIDSRIPIWIIKYEASISDNSDIQILWIPDNTSHALPANDATFAFQSNRLVPDTPEGVQIAIQPLATPCLSIKNSDVSLRWSAFINGWDLTLNYLYHYDDQAVLSTQQLIIENRIALTIQPELKRSHLLGGSFSNTFDDITLRGELGYSTDKYFIGADPRNSDIYVKGQEVSYVLGVDWYGLSDSLLSLQFFQGRIFDISTVVSKPKVDTTLTLLAQTKLWNDTLHLETLLLKNMHHHDSLLRTKIVYDFNDQTKISLYLDRFSGNKNGLFGQFDSNDRIMFSYEYFL